MMAREGRNDLEVDLHNPVVVGDLELSFHGIMVYRSCGNFGKPLSEGEIQICTKHGLS